MATACSKITEIACIDDIIEQEKDGETLTAATQKI